MIFSSSLCGVSLATNVAVKPFFLGMDSDMIKEMSIAFKRLEAVLTVERAFWRLFSGILEGKRSGILLIFIHIF
jgi:hypothetical protein